MVNSYLPHFIYRPYEELLQSPGEQDTMETIAFLLHKTFDFLGKLHLLEYAQKKKLSTSINYFIFAKLDPQDIKSWITLIENIHAFWKAQNIETCFGNHCPFLFDSINKDLIQRLLWFCKIVSVKTEVLLVSPSDIGECKEHLQIFLSFLSFFSSISYEVKNKKSYLVCANQQISLQPFYSLKLQGSSGLQISENIQENPMERYAKEWLSEAFTQYQKEKEGHIQFPEPCKNTVILPWVEIAIKEALKQVFMLPNDMKERFITVEGYPATGKTTLCTNMKTLAQDYCDFVIQYFISPNCIYQDSVTFKAWLYRSLQSLFFGEDNTNEKLENDALIPDLQKIQLALEKNNKKIICCIDGIDYMPDENFKSLQQLITTKPFSTIIFVFFKRSYTTNSIKSSFKIHLNPSDNIFYEDFFTPNYIKLIIDRYLKDDTSKIIFRHVVQNYQNKIFTIKDLSEELEIYTPKVLKCIQRIKPLLKLYPENSFQLFHKITRNFVDFLPAI